MPLKPSAPPFEPGKAYKAGDVFTFGPRIDSHTRKATDEPQSFTVMHDEATLDAILTLPAPKRPRRRARRS